MAIARIATALAVVLAGLIGWAQPAQPAAVTTCDTSGVVRRALDELGEHAVSFRMVSPDEMAADVGAENIYGYAEPERITFSSAMECRYVAATVAHEVAHVWQYRAADARDGDLYAELGHDAAEIVADCVAMLTGWQDYRPYLTEREKRTGMTGCTDAEIAAANALRTWAR